MRVALGTVSLCAVVLAVAGCVTTSPTPSPVFPGVVDVVKLEGRWYEIASIPQSAQRACTGTAFNIAPREPGAFTFLTDCFRGSLDGPLETLKGEIKVADSNTFTKFKMRYGGLIWRDFWIVDVGVGPTTYDYIVFGDPAKQGLWVLSRSREMGARTYSEIVKTALSRGYDVARLLRTLQRPE